ncbi:phosphate acetyltransferase [Jannaschia pagri]|uniref:Phosphate acetyltransferase n=1 Tax=Jannaschia pagri TaxID=2829797 RepID=A0ABQ4NNU0_9RHOB|nr:MULTISPECIES: phosphotransacetylase [unclassified Jannaschia]GIT92213.1 phosphate acetyltransferase [Jannaschia sp. AI_61]GIT96048.1 phosphate acetyltransferase [Jannaschia sp. AI_62]
MSPLTALRDRAKAARHHIVLPEGTDPRVQEAAARATSEGLARITLLAPEGTAMPDGVTGEDPTKSARRDAMSAAFLRARAKKSPTQDQADAAINDPLTWAALMVREGLADGTIGGAVATTSDTVRAALQMISTAPSAPMVSSFFLMVLPDSHPTRPGQGLIFSDCGLVIEPSATELAAIAAQATASAAALLPEPPKTAMLSFSTMGSAKHSNVNKVTEALEIARTNGLTDIDGELQFDAAFDSSVGAKKAPSSGVAGQANVMVFPNLDAGNIGYKIAQRIGGATAIGPVLQGLAKPANDLSRGCTADDIIDMIAVTSAQIDAL